MWNSALCHGKFYIVKNNTLGPLMLTKINFLITISHASQFAKNILKERLEIKVSLSCFLLGFGSVFCSEFWRKLRLYANNSLAIRKILHILFDNVKLIDLYDCTKERSLIKNLTTCIAVSPKRQGLWCACKCEAFSTQREINREMIGQNNNGREFSLKRLCILKSFLTALKK